MHGRLLACWMLLAGCDLDAGYAGPDSRDDPNLDAGPLQLASRGRFHVIEGIHLQPGGAMPYARVDGLITTDDLRPLYQVVAAQGDCRLLEIHEPPFCEPACSGICIAKDSCVAGPHYLSAGYVRVDGLLSTVTIVHQPDNQYTALGDLPFDLFTSEAVVSLSAEGDEVNFFFMTAGGVRPLGTDLPLTPVDLDDDADFTISWASPDPTTGILLEIIATNSFNGQPPPAILECSVSDDGDLVVPASLIRLFPRALGSCPGADCPRARLRRYHGDAVIRTSVPIELVVGHEISFDVRH